MNYVHVLLTILFCCTSAKAQGVDIVVNGGFESGDFTGWIPAATSPNSATVVSPGSSSSLAAQMFVAQPSLVDLSTVPLGTSFVAPGQTATITFDLRGSVPGNLVIVEFLTFAAAGMTGQVLPCPPLNPNPGLWSTASSTVTIGPDASGGVALRFRLLILSGTALLEIDNVRVEVDLSNYPGNGDDLALTTGVNASPDDIDIKAAMGGDVLVVDVASPGGTFDFAPFTLWAQLVSTASGVPNLGGIGFPEIYLDLSLPVGVIVGDGGGAALGTLVLIPGGSTHGFVLPPALNGLGSSIVMQSLVASNMALNGLYAITDAHEIRVP